MALNRKQWLNAIGEQSRRATVRGQSSMDFHAGMLNKRESFPVYVPWKAQIVSANQSNAPKPPSVHTSVDSHNSGDDNFFGAESDASKHSEHEEEESVDLSGVFDFGDTDEEDQ